MFNTRKVTFVVLNVEISAAAAAGTLKRTLGIKVDLQEDYFQVSLPGQFLPATADRGMWDMPKINLCVGDGSPTPPEDHRCFHYLHIQLVTLYIHGQQEKHRLCLKLVLFKDLVLVSLQFVVSVVTECHACPSHE